MAALTLTVKEQQLLAVFISQLTEIPKIDWEVLAPTVGHKYARNARAAFSKVWEKLKGGSDRLASLTIKEQQLLTAFVSQLPAIPQVDWDTVAPLVGHKYTRNARAAFNKVWDKLKGGNGDDAGKGNTLASAMKSSPVKTPRSSPEKKKVGPRKIPVKASSGMKTNKSPKKTADKDANKNMLNHATNTEGSESVGLSSPDALDDSSFKKTLLVTSEDDSSERETSAT